MNNNVQLGATYAIGKTSTAKYADGYEAGAKYINASASEIGEEPSTASEPVWPW